VTTLFAAPALPLHSAGKYVAAAYIVFLALVLIYVAIMAVRLGRNQRDLEKLTELAAEMRGRELDGSEGGQLLGNRPGGDSPDHEWDAEKV
jgi:hypothetical protein